MKLKINIISAALLMIAGSVFTACNSEGVRIPPPAMR